MWQDGINLNFTCENSALRLKKRGQDVVIPTTWRNLQVPLNWGVVEDKLESMYMRGLGKAVLVALPQGSRIGFIYEHSEIGMILQKIPDLGELFSQIKAQICGDSKLESRGLSRKLGDESL